MALIREKIRRHKYGVLRHIDDAEKRRETYQNQDHEAILCQAEDICRMARRLIERIRSVISAGEPDLKRDSIRVLQESGYLTASDQEPQIENISCFQIPTTEILYYEGMCRELSEPLLYICFYDGIPEAGKSAVIIFYPEDLLKHEKKALYYLMETIFQKEGILTAVRQRNLEEMKYGIGICMRDYIGRLLME